jgi:hypothetical protein
MKHRVIRKKLEQGKADTVEEAKRQYERQKRALQNLTDQAQKLNLGYDSGS